MSLIPSWFAYGRRSSFNPFALDQYNPLDGFPFGFSSALSPFAGDIHPAAAFMCEASTFANTRIDWKETTDAHVFKADLPGLKKEEVKVEVEDGRVLQISGEHRVEEREKTDMWHRVERSSGKFLRRFRLPENAKSDEVRTAMENGVLTVTVPKVNESNSKQGVKSIAISG